MSRQLGFLGIDQFGQYYQIKQYPRKELLDQLGFSKADKMFVDTKSGKTQHTGYVIGGHWVSIFQLNEWGGIEK